MSTLTSRLDWKSIQGQRCEPNRYRYLPPDDPTDDGYVWPARYGDWSDARDGQWIVPRYTSGSDYSGSLIHRSNFEVFSEEFQDGEDQWWVSVCGGHSTFALVIDVHKAPSEALEFFGALEDYPLASDDHHSQLLCDAEDEAWQQWGAQDFEEALEKRFGIELDRSIVAEPSWLELFREAAEKANEYWVNEEGSSVYINVKKVADKVALKDLAPYIESEAS